MRLIGNFYSEWAHDRGNFQRTLLVTLVACAVGGIASAAVILSLASPPISQPGAPSISPRAIVRNVGASEPPKAAQDGPVVETTPSPGAIVRNAGASEEPKTAQDEPKVETAPRPAATGMVVNRDESVTQTEAEHQAEVHSHQSRKHGRVREPYWRRFAHNFSLKPFGSW
jgi:hypothetical protein